MKYFVCLILPPLAVLQTGKIGAFLLSVILTCLLWIPGIVYAIMVTNKHDADMKDEELMKEKLRYTSHQQIALKF